MLEKFLETHPKKHLIFDFDQTLFTLELPWEVYIKELTAKLLELDSTLEGFAAGKSLNDMENEAVRRHRATALEIRRQYSAQFEKQYLTGVVEHTELTNFIRSNKHDYSFYLWTSNMRETVAPILKEQGMDSLFTKVVTKSDVQFTKPEPEGFEMIFESAYQTKQEYLMIGDSVNDAGAAAQAGIEFFKVMQ